MRKGRKRRLAVFLGAAAVMVLLCTLSGCGRHATRGELIDWFQKNYTDAKLVVSREKTEEDNGWTIGYMAYLKDRPELVFQLQSRRVIVGGLREHHTSPILTRSMVHTTLRRISGGIPFPTGRKGKGMALFSTLRLYTVRRTSWRRRHRSFWRSFASLRNRPRA